MLFMNEYDIDRAQSQFRHPKHDIDFEIMSDDKDCQIVTGQK